MIPLSELEGLLALVAFDARLNFVQGLDAFRRLLAADDDGRVLQFLSGQLPGLEGERRGGIAFVLAEHYRLAGDLENLRALFAIDDAIVKESVLNASWGDPSDDPRMGRGIVALAIGAAGHAAAGVRTEVCSVIQNQCAWGVDVGDAVALLPGLLGDESSRVRQQAAYAASRLAKGKYDVSACISPLRENLKHVMAFVRTASAAAFWQLSRSKHDIGIAVPDLVLLLADAGDWSEPRKQAAGALLHHARKSAHHAAAVKSLVAATRLDEHRQEIGRFLAGLAKLE